MVAIELFRAVTVWKDRGWGNFALHFVKNKEQQEVDFLISADNNPVVLIESKRSDTQPTVALRKFQSRLKVPAVQLVRNAGGFRMLRNDDQHILVAPAWRWLAALPW